MGGACALVAPAQTQGFGRLPLELGGVCPVTFARGGAAYGNAYLGLVQHAGKLYALASRDAAAAFARDPEACVPGPLSPRMAACLPGPPMAAHGLP